MFSSSIPQFDLDDLSFFNNNNVGDFGFDGFNFLESSNLAGPSQTYQGADVLGDFNNYPEYKTPYTAPASFNPWNKTYPNKEYVSHLHQGIPVSSELHPVILPSQLSSYSTLVHPSPVPVPPRGSPPLSPNQRTTPITPTLHPSLQSQAAADPEGLDFDSSSVADNFSLPAAYPSLGNDSTFGELLSQSPPIDPPSTSLPSSNPIAGSSTPEIHLTQSVASPSGPKRTRQSARVSRRYNPLHAAQKKAASDEGWLQTLHRFRAHADTLYGVQDGQPSGGLVPEKALASLNKFVKEDLKRSPLNEKKAGEGKRSRDVETYLEGLLQAIRPVDSAPAPAGDGSVGRDTIAKILSRLADELETKLVPIYQEPALRQPPGGLRPGKGTNSKRDEKQKIRSQTEKDRRGNERYHLGRISRLFRMTRKLWCRKDTLGLVLLFLLYGPAAFPPNFVSAHPADVEP